MKRPSTIPNPSSSRKQPNVRVYENGQLADIREKDKITKIGSITQTQAVANYLCHVTLECIIFYNLVFCATTGILKIFDPVKIDKDLHVQLE